MRVLSISFSLGINKSLVNFKKIGFSSIYVYMQFICEIHILAQKKWVGKKFFWNCNNCHWQPFFIQEYLEVLLHLKENPQNKKTQNIKIALETILSAALGT